ncbi:MAG: extracellular solute-binding protein family 1 [Anaerocolumna sp.]|nr:extracellular solute-binding protein family 1 [Anaerocolumna sp.]
MRLKRFMAILLTAILLVGITACSSDKTSTDTGSNTEVTPSTDENKEDSNSGDKITLSMAWWGSQTRHDATVKVIELYESLNPAIDIQYEFYDFDGYFTKLNTLVASDTVWDIFQLGGNFPTYLNSIVPLNDYIAKGTIDTSNTNENYLATTQWEGKQIGISNGVNTYGIAYDPAMFTQAGLQEPAENWTWEEWKNACLTIKDKLGIYGSSKMDDFIAGASAGVSQEDFSLNFFALTNDKLGFEDPSLLINYFKIRKELVDAGAYPDSGAIAEIKDIEGDYLVTGDAAMTWVASNQMPTLAAAAGREIKLAPIPRKTADGPSGATIQSSQMLCVSTSSSVPEEAAKFINFFENDEEANKILNGERGVSIMSNIREMLLAQADEATTAMYNFVDLIGTFETGEINVVSPAEKTEIEDQYKLFMEKVIYGEATPEEAAQGIYDFAQKKFQ